jgi:asparagine synthase (glutamine-hydrolysing)
MDVSGAVDLYVNRHARAIAPIRLTGNYGSEVLRGNVAFKPIALRDDVFEPELARSLATAARTYATERRGRRLSFIVFKQVPWHHYGRLAVEESQLSVRSPYLDNDLVALLYRAPDEALADDLASLRLVADGNPALTTVGTDRGRTWGAPSLASRARRWYQDFTFKAEYAYDYGMPGWLARVDRSLRPLRVERHVLGRHKFAHFRVWYRDRLAPYVKDVLLDPRTLRRPYLRGARVEDLVRGHTTGRRNFTLEIHRLLTIELLQRQLIERA